MDSQTIETERKHPFDRRGAGPGRAVSRLNRGWRWRRERFEPEVLTTFRGWRYSGGRPTAYGSVISRSAQADAFGQGELRPGLGRDQESVAAALYELLRPDGYILVYNVAVEPTPAENALSRELWEGVGFEIHAFDQDDRGAAYGMGKELGWEAWATPLDENMRARYTVVRRPTDGCRRSARAHGAQHGCSPEIPEGIAAPARLGG